LFVPTAAAAVAVRCDARPGPHPRHCTDGPGDPPDAGEV